MARLSNLFRRNDDDAADDGPPEGFAPVYRPALPEEMIDALRLLLATSTGLATERQASEFLGFTGQRGVDPGELWIAKRSAIDWALLPVISPGKTMLLLSPAYLQPQNVRPHALELTNVVCAHHARAGIELAQLLLDPNQLDVQSMYADASFVRLAELIYLSRAIRRAPEPADLLLPTGLKLIAYDPIVSHDLFARAVIESYEGSLDCPGLNGVRDIGDVMDGHKSAGEFDASLWFAVVNAHREPQAVLLLSRSLYADALELVYLGLIPSARGKGLSNALMNLALASVVRVNRTELTLAVDALNAPALSLYFRFGMRRVSSRVAMVRRLNDRR